MKNKNLRLRKRLTNDFFKNERFKIRVNGFKPKAMQVLLSYSWAGNIRELKNVIHAALSIEYIGVDSISRLISVTDVDRKKF